MAEEQEYGGFWARFVALVIDNAVVFVILLAAGVSMGTVVAMAGMEGMMSLVGGVVFTIVPFLYWPVLESSGWQATVGKRVMGLQVTDLEGNRLSFVHALLRAFAKIISSIPAGIGFLIAAFTARKQALHDIIVKTLVVRIGPSQLWKILLALIVGVVVMVASAAALFYYVLMPMFKGGMEDMMKDGMKGAPQMKTIPAPAPAGKAPQPQAKPAAPAPQIPAAPAAAKPEAAPAPAIAAPVKPEPAPAPVVAAPVKPAAAPAKPEPRPRTEAAPRAATAPAPVAAADRPGKPGPKFNDIMTAVLYRDATGVNELLDLGRWVDRRDSAGFTPLMVAVRLRDARMAQLLIQRGAEVNASAAAGESPLAIARKNRDTAMVELLQRSGAR